jgi:hypothetical protein
MKTAKTAAFLIAATMGTLLATRAAQSQTSDCPCPCPPAAESDNGGDPGTASIGYFHEQLSPYGRWVERQGYGEVWVPAVRAGWRPYTTGHWVYTDQGWAWVADESWGWAPFHYGRWFHDAGIGWGWVPGTVWAPAWVAWRHGGGYVGWAALPPAVGFTVGVGVNFGGVSLDAAIAPSYFAFVSERAILTPRLSTVIVAPERNVTIIHNTTNITNYTVVNNRVVNNGVNVQRIEQVTGRPVPRVSTASQVAFYQPPVVAKAARATKAETFVNRPARLGAASSASQSAAQGAAAGHNAGLGATPRMQTKSATAAGGTSQGAGTGASHAAGTGAPHGTTGTGTRHGTTGTTGTSTPYATGTGAPHGTTGSGAHHGTTGTGASHGTTGTGAAHGTTGTGGRHGTTGTGAPHGTTGTGGRHGTTGTGAPHGTTAPAHGTEPPGAARTLALPGPVRTMEQPAPARVAARSLPDRRGPPFYIGVVVLVGRSECSRIICTAGSRPGWKGLRTRQLSRIS